MPGLLGPLRGPWPRPAGDWSKGSAALQELMDVFESDSDASQAIMTAASECGQWREVLLLHRRLLQSVDDAAPEQVGEVFANAASGLMRARQWQRALGLITEFRAQCRDSLTFWSVAHTAERSSLERSDRVPMFQLLLSMFSNFGTWDQVLGLLQEARRCPEAVTTTDIASVMTALTNQKRWRMSLKVFAESPRLSGCRCKDIQGGLSGMGLWPSLAAGHQPVSGGASHTG